MPLTESTIACLTPPDTDPDDEVMKTATQVIESHGKTVEHYPVGTSADSIDWEDTAFLAAIGGDGTFLEAVQITAPTQTPVLAVNAGTLGFLARIHPDDFEQALTETLTHEADIIDREMLAVSGAVEGTGINDVMIEPLPPETPTDRKITAIHAYIDDTYVGEFTGSGLAVATPTGSTGVAFSAGGPVHDPTANSSLQITPLHTHNAGVRPVIVDSETVITLIPETDVTVAVDGGRTHATVSADTELQVTGAEQTAKIVRTSVDESFFDALSGKLGWGLRDVDESGPRFPDDE